MDPPTTCPPYFHSHFLSCLPSCFPFLKPLLPEDRLDLTASRKGECDLELYHRRGSLGHLVQLLFTEGHPEILHPLKIYLPKEEEEKAETMAVVQMEEAKTAREEVERRWEGGGNRHFASVRLRCLVSLGLNSPCLYRGIN